METQQLQQVSRLVDIIFRRKGLLICSILIALAVGLAFYLKQPKLYESYSMLSYQRQGLNPTRMSPDSNASIKDIVSSLTQIVTSRSNLERIIVQEKLYSAELAQLPMEDVVIKMRGQINIRPSREGNTFQVSFAGKNPAQVARVTNALAARFIEENLKYREERASDTSAYIEDELRMAKEMLDQREELMRIFKLKNYNEMPDQQGSNVSRLIALQNQVQSKQTSIQDLERTRLLLEEQITVRKQLLENAIAQSAGAGRASLVETDQQRLGRYQLEMQALLGRYTEQHPQVKSLQRRISQLEESLAARGLSKPQGEGEESGPQSRFDQGLFDLGQQIKRIDFNIEKLTEEIDLLETKIAEIDEWVANAPAREAEWTSLTREYAQMKQHYDHLVSQNLQARSALNLERNQRGSQFRIEDPALVPNKPTKPDFAKIMLIALVAGFGLGGGISLAIELFDTTYRSPFGLEEDLKNHYGLELICAVPNLPLKREVVRQRIFATVGAIVILIMGSTLAAAFFHFYRNGQIVL